jgi:hypothetical protein
MRGERADRARGAEQSEEEEEVEEEERVKERVGRVQLESSERKSGRVESLGVESDRYPACGKAERDQYKSPFAAHPAPRRDMFE